MLIASRLKHNLIDCDLNTTFNYLELKKLSNEKILGVYEDHILSGTIIFSMFQNSTSYLWLLSQIRSYLKEQDRLLYYNAYIMPCLEYWCTVCGNSSNFNTYKIKKKCKGEHASLVLGKFTQHLKMCEII